MFNGSPRTICTKKAARSRLIFDDNVRIAAWCQERIEHFAGWGSDPKCIGYERDGELKGGVVYTNYTPTNVFASIVCEAPITKRFLYSMFWCPFGQWNVKHIACAIEASNTRSIRLCSHLGFRAEGRMRESAINGEDVIIMGMLKRECRHI
jgi:hypothetical protein